MNDKLSKLIASEGVLLLDGAMGSMLMDAGLQQGNAPEEWNVIRPDGVRAVHHQYIQSGSQVILTNSFGGNRVRLDLHQLADRALELNRAAAQLARFEADGASHPVVVAGSMGPTGELLEPLGRLTFEQAKMAYAEQAEGLAAGGVDVLWIETISDLNEVKAAIEGARETTDLPITATMTFDARGRTVMGVAPAQALTVLREYDLVAIGANCGNGPEEVEKAIAEMRAEDSHAVLIAKANAGVPELRNGELVYAGTPAVMADYATQVRDLGAKLIGACCGSTPAHINAMATALRK